LFEKTGELTRFEWLRRNEPIEVIKNGYMYTRETEQETDLQQVVQHQTSPSPSASPELNLFSSHDSENVQIQTIAISTSSKKEQLDML
jgi:hypothetical protein